MGFKHSSSNLEMKKRTINDAVIQKKILDEVKTLKSKDRKDNSGEAEKDPR